MVIEMKATGVIDQASSAIKSAKNAIDSMGDQSGAGEMTIIIKDLINSLKDLIDELRLVLLSSKQTGIIHNAKEIARDADSIYRNLKE
jgi:predicted translin family RNA/ssDNA-binding protein